MTTADPRVDAYLASLPADQRAQLEALRDQIATLAPEADETIAYAMPAYRLGGAFLCSFAAWKRHSTLYPVGDDLMTAYADRLRGYGPSKSSLHFSPSKPIPDGLVEELIRNRTAAIKRGGR
jgi:uncharacterized protein YdhG (YjbR/CyaY superfamily)